MPTRHSKHAGDRHHFSYHEKQQLGIGSTHQRIGSDSQLPFGYCALSTYPAEDPVVSPSGRIYSRETIIEYLLNKSKELKNSWKEYESQQNRIRADMERQMNNIREAELSDFRRNTEVVVSSGQKRTQSEAFSSSASASASGDAMGDDRTNVSSATTITAMTDYQRKRQKKIDETDRDVRLEQLKSVSPWVPQFTPHAEKTLLAEPPKRPLSPFSGTPLRAKDLIPIELVREDNTEDSTVRFVCPVSRKTITSQKVILIKPTGTIMTEQAARELAFPSMTCPMTGKQFDRSDVLELVSASSGFAAKGNVEAKIYRPSIN